MRKETVRKTKVSAAAKLLAGKVNEKLVNSVIPDVIAQGSDDPFGDVKKRLDSLMTSGLEDLLSSGVIESEEDLRENEKQLAIEGAVGRIEARLGEEVKKQLVAAEAKEKEPKEKLRYVERHLKRRINEANDRLAQQASTIQDLDEANQDLRAQLKIAKKGAALGAVNVPENRGGFWASLRSLFVETLRAKVPFSALLGILIALFAGFFFVDLPFLDDSDPVISVVEPNEPVVNFNWPTPADEFVVESSEIVNLSAEGNVRIKYVAHRKGVPEIVSDPNDLLKGTGLDTYTLGDRVVFHCNVRGCEVQKANRIAVINFGSKDPKETYKFSGIMSIGSREYPVLVMKDNFVLKCNN